MGKRGEGWFLIQLALFALIVAAARLGTWPLPGWLVALGAALLAAGGVFGTLGLLALGRNLSPFPKPIAGGQLVTTGVYGIVRHPIYTGLILGTLGWSLLMRAPAGLALFVALFVFFDLKSRREETWLLESYPDYRAYRARVKKLIPWVY
jgi:protein-S-isoprenylcysteine O-methyltransferase Ste14